MDSKVPPPTKIRTVRRVLLGLAVASFLYVGSYAALSLTGGWVVSESGDVRIILAVSDIFLWQPRYGRGQWFRGVDGEFRLRGDLLGQFYAPLILFDQRYIHRTVRFMGTDGSFSDLTAAPPLSEYHPLCANPYHGRWPYGIQDAGKR